MRFRIVRVVAIKSEYFSFFAKIRKMHEKFSKVNSVWRGIQLSKKKQTSAAILFHVLFSLDVYLQALLNEFCLS